MDRWSILLKKRVLELLSSTITSGTDISSIVSSEAQRLAIVGDKPLPGEPRGGRTAMDFWRACFTPKILDVRPMYNYEVFETNGDSVIQSITFSLLSEKFPDSITDEKLTLFKSTHLSKQAMAHISRKFRLPEMIRPRTPDNMKESDSMAEDILEALFGTVYILVNRLFGVGKGTVVATRLVLLMYGAEPFNLEALRKNPTTEFKEINEELGWLSRGTAIVGSAILYTPVHQEDGTHVATMRIIGKDIIEGLRERGKIISPDDIFVIGTGSSELEARDNMYINAILKYQELGIDADFVARSKRERELRNWINDGLLVDTVVREFLKKLDSAGFVDWRFYIPSRDLYKGSSSKRYVRLIGIRADGSEVSLNMAAGGSDKRAIANTVSNYAIGR